MRKEREELEDLRDELDKLMDFIRNMENGNLPYFYRYFDAMKNNIEIFFRIGEEDTEDIIPVLERDWKASHTIQIHTLLLSKSSSQSKVCLCTAPHT